MQVRPRNAPVQRCGWRQLPHVASGGRSQEDLQRSEESSNEQIFAGWPKGSEAGWAGYFVGHPESSRADFWRLWVFHDPAWNWATFDFDRDLAYADQKMAAVNAVDTDLRPFKAHKGNVMYHGWADPVVPPEDGIRYYEAVQRSMGGAEKTTDFYRLFMVPGMGHCVGGPGPKTFDAIDALDHWVAQGKAPEIIASHATNGTTDRTRPLCPYPQVAKWKGAGSTDDATNFVCAVESRVANSGGGRGPAK